MSTNSRIIELASIISSSTADIQSTLDKEGTGKLSFDENAPAIPLSVHEAQAAVLDATQELNDLLKDPFSRLYGLILNDEAAVLKTIAYFNIAALVPAGGQASFADIAKQTALTEQMVARIIRHAALMRVFYEPKPGFVAHTQASKMIAQEDYRTWVLAGNEEPNPAVAKLPEALEKWPGSQNFSETGYTLANGASFFETIGKDPARAQRSGVVMNLQLSQPSFDVKYGLEAFDWGSLGKARVLDIGGGVGRFALPLAQRFPDLSFVVQDMPQIVEHADAGNFSDRVKFESYDYFSPQKVQADVVSFRSFFNVWSDHLALAIIKAQVPALKSGTRIIVQQQLLPEPGVGPRWRERDLRASDIEFAAFLNARERTLEDWKTLFTTADPGFVFEKVTEPVGSALAILEFKWQGSA